MRRTLTIRFAITIVLIAGAVPVIAHHGSAAFDVGKKLIIPAIVTEWVWANPHCFLKFDVADADGTVRHWIAETSNPPDMINRGW